MGFEPLMLLLGDEWLLSTDRTAWNAMQAIRCCTVGRWMVHAVATHRMGCSASQRSASQPLVPFSREILRRSGQKLRCACQPTGPPACRSSEAQRKSLVSAIIGQLEAVAQLRAQSVEVNIRPPVGFAL